MSKNKTYRIRTEVGVDKNITVNLDQSYDTFEILSLKLGQSETYRLHDSNYGVIVGRVMANNGFGVENAKVSIFISASTDTNKNAVMSEIYPFTNTSQKDSNGVRYNLLTDKKASDCHQVVGTFPNKSYLLDNDVLLEVFDTYYKYTARTNRSGDYMICGVPTGSHTLHMDFDISDCGILSQRPRDLVYQGYTIEQFQNPNQFKTDKEIDSLSQIFSQNTTVNVNPFWGNSEDGKVIGITRCDINVSYTFTPTCVFIGSIVGDNASNGLSKKCIPTENMGLMEELTTGEGRIEMIRKTFDNTVEEFEIKGTELINGDGIWCYQIPMNLDYVKHDEYGNIVATNDSSKGIPTRARVRFRVSMNDFEEASENYFRAKVLIPHNPKYSTKEDRGNDENADILDYNFGSKTDENSFRDLFWNNVYTVKSYIPRFQKSKKNGNWKDKKFTGIKSCNIYGTNNPMPYNNIRIRLPLAFMILCALIKTYVRVVYFINGVLNVFGFLLGQLSNLILIDEDADWSITTKIFKIDLDFNGFKNFLKTKVFSKIEKVGMQAARLAIKIKYIVLADGLCPDLENWYFSPSWRTNSYWVNIKNLIEDEEKKYRQQKYVEGEIEKDMINPLITTYNYITKEEEEIDAKEDVATGMVDNTSIDEQNKDDNEKVCLTTNVDYLLSCVEMNLAQEYKVINFDFYNDWINGVIYMPRWARFVTKKRTYFWGAIKIKAKVKACTSSDSQDVYGDEDMEITPYQTGFFERYNRYTQQCSLGYTVRANEIPRLNASMPKGCKETNFLNKQIKQKCHTNYGMSQQVIFGKNNGGAVHAQRTLQNQLVYYFKPCEWVDVKNTSNYTSGGGTAKRKVNLFGNDIVLLGSLNECNEQGLAQAFKYITSTSYKMPTNLALTNMESNAVLYGTSESTYCGNKMNKASDGTLTVDEQDVVPVSQTFAKQMDHYDKQNGQTSEFSDYDEYVGITEAAGISWNYSGPDQGVKNSYDEKNKKKKNLKDSFIDDFYQPGGHFLGLSCTNSETNIKSCLNLSRVCEVGTSLSQRHEKIYALDNSKANQGIFDFRYRYFVPTGLISRNDIIAPDFRSMFATMNHRKLISTTVDSSTSYKKYEFTYLRPDVFGGEFQKWVTGSTTPYNIKLTGVTTKDMNLEVLPEEQDDGAHFLIEDGLPGVVTDQKEVEDLKNQTYRRTVERSTEDYWKFRLGLDNFTDPSVKFLSNGSNDSTLPQFENSFYFYFGLRPGSTAIDEFNKQFFSECKDKVNDEI